MTFDPRPTKFQNSIMPGEQLEKFVKNLEDNVINSLWYLHLSTPHVTDPNVIMCEERTPETSELDLVDELEQAVVKCSKKIWEFNQVRKEVSRPFELGYTIGQRDNEEWLKDRAWHACASSCKTLLGPHKQETIITWLQQHVWLLSKKTNSSHAVWH